MQFRGIVIYGTTSQTATFVGEIFCTESFRELSKYSAIAQSGCFFNTIRSMLLPVGELNVVGRVLPSWPFGTIQSLRLPTKVVELLKTS